MVTTRVAHRSWATLSGLAMLSAALMGLLCTADGFSLALRTGFRTSQPPSLCVRKFRKHSLAASNIKCQWDDGSGGGAPMDKEPLEVSEENVELALGEAKEILQTMFGNYEENRKIGITGDVSLVDVDGPFLTLRLEGRFWHKRVDVLARVENYLRTRIPEIVEVSIEDPAQLDDNNPDNQ